MDIMKTLSDNLISLRKKQFYSQYTLARASGISRSTIAKLELCMNKDVSLRTIEKLSSALGIDPIMLIHSTRRN